MKIHQFEQSQTVPISQSDAWSFFSNPRNLDEMTPPGMGFRTVSGGDEPMFAGQVIVHRIRIAPMVWSTWVTEITAVEEGRYFIDQQRFGPYRFWHHLHRFSEVEDGVEILDRIHYALPLYPFGEMGGFAIRKQLDTVFRFRREFLERRFGSP